MTRRTIATTLGVLALATAPAAATTIPSISATSAERGWPHRMTASERRDLTSDIGVELESWIGTMPVAGGCHWTACTFRWSAGARHRVAIRVWEDGSYRVLAVLG